MLRLSLVCHGATSANRTAAFPEDEPLEPRALAAAQAHERGMAAALTLTSPALRARQTAEAMDLFPRTEPLLRDCDYGRWAGHSLAALEEQEPTAVALFMRDPTACPHGGESIADVVARTADWLDTLSEGPIIAVTHASVIRAVLLHVLSAPLEAFWRIDLPPLSTTVLTSDGRRWAWRPTLRP